MISLILLTNPLSFHIERGALSDFIRVHPRVHSIDSIHGGSKMSVLTVYLAGADPGVSDDLETIARYRKVCLQRGATCVRGLSSMMHEEESSLQVSGSGLGLLLQSDLVIVNLAQHESAAVNTSTAFELGFARARGLIIVGFHPTEERVIYNVEFFEKSALDPFGWGSRIARPRYMEDAWESCFNLKLAYRMDISIFSSFEQALDDGLSRVMMRSAYRKSCSDLPAGQEGIADCQAS